MGETLDREALLGRIRKLQQRTTSNGCTEAEAMEAARLMASLMDRYGFSQDDLAMKTEAITEDAYYAKGRQLLRVRHVVGAIGKFCDCRCWMQNFGGQQKLAYFGLETDVAAALYFTHLVDNAIRMEWREHNRGLPKMGAKEAFAYRRQFEYSMAVRIARRFVEMKQARDAHVDAPTGRSGRELVVVKNAVVEEAFAKTNISKRLRKVSAGPKASHAAAQAAGWQAGGRVALSTGVEARNNKKIGGG